MAKRNGNGTHPASYSRFMLKDIEQLGLEIRRKRFFKTVQPLLPGEWLLQTLSDIGDLNLDSEKAKSEHLITPVIREMFRRNQTKFTYFSGYTFDVAPEKGLNGVCDYLLSKELDADKPKAPVFCIVEAKNENLETGVPQCAAQMYAAQIANQAIGHPAQRVFGAVTFGQYWRFLEVENQTIWKDRDAYSLDNLPQLLGAFQMIIDLA